MRGLDGFCRWTILVAFSGLLLMGMMNVLNRFVVFKFNTAWTEELARYFSIYVVFLGAAIATRTQTHPYLSIVLTTMEKKPFWGIFVPWIKLGGFILETFVMIFIMVKGIEIVFIVHGQTAPASQISMSWPYLAVPSGVLFMLLYQKRYLYRRGKK